MSNGSGIRQPAAVVFGDADRLGYTVSWLADSGYSIQTAATVPELNGIMNPAPDLLVYAGPENLLQSLRARFSRTMFVLVPLAEVGCAAQANGDMEYEELPLEGSERVAGDSASTHLLRRQIARVARSDSGTLILGETGTGKELIAELIHLNSFRSHKPFVCVNCAAIPEHLVESELFGFEKGAFTGAFTRMCGKLLLADGGTLFLDEVGELTLAAQAKLLRALEGKPIYLLGGQRPVELNVRVIAATNRDLEADVHQGRFRQDLYYRLNILRLQTTPLRERLNDIPPLVRHFISEFNVRCGGRVRSFTADSMERLLTHSWPGNVRELRNVVEASFAHRDYLSQTELGLPEDIRSRLAHIQPAVDVEKEMILKTLAATGWNRSRTAARLQLSRMTLYRKMDKYGLTGIGGNRRELPKKRVTSAPVDSDCSKATAG